MSKLQEDYPSEKEDHQPDAEQAGDEQPQPQQTQATGTAASQRQHTEMEIGTPSLPSDEEEEKAQILALERTLPRPDWYTSDDEISETESIMEEEVSDLTRSTEDGGKPLIIVYVVLCVIAFAFNLAATCPIPWMKAKHGGREYGVWRAKKGGRPDYTVRMIKTCSEEQQYYFASAAWSTVSTFFSFASVIGGILIVVGKGHLGGSAALSFFGGVFSLVSWACFVALFHYDRCGKGKYSKIARLDAGFALTLLAFVMHLFGLIVLFVHLMLYFTKGVHSGKPNVPRFFFMSCMAAALLLYSVGCVYPLWGKKFDLVSVSVTTWHIEIYDRITKNSVFLGRQEYQCDSFRDRFKTIAGFNILTNTFTGLSTIFSVGACYSNAFKGGSLMLGYTGLVFGLVLWVLTAVVRHTRLCHAPSTTSLWDTLGYNGIPTGVPAARIVYDGYSMKEGFGLWIAAWAIQLAGCIVNSIF